MKTMILLVGFPGVGKSHVARILDKKLKHALYFDSDLFSKIYMRTHKFSFTGISRNEEMKWRLIFHQAKLNKIKEYFKKYDIIFLDTCFDLQNSRKIFYKFAKDNRLKLLVVEVKCPSHIVKKRIFKNRHEKERMVGSKASRWKLHEDMKLWWKPIKKVDFTLYSQKDVDKQIEKFLKQQNLS